jgi:hypothetical protein
MRTPLFGICSGVGAIMAAPFVFGRPGDPPGQEIESRLYLSLTIVAIGVVAGLALDGLRKDSEENP